jgi:hypothetical protein
MERKQTFSLFNSADLILSSISSFVTLDTFLRGSNYTNLKEFKNGIRK